MASKSPAAKAHERAYQKRWRQETNLRRQQENLCYHCGKPRATTKTPSASLCARCARKHALRNQLYRDRKRVKEGRLFVGRRASAPMVKSLNVGVERALIPAIDELQRQRQAQSPHERIPLSRTVREAICEFGGDPPARVPPYEFKGLMCPGVILHFKADAPTWAIIRYHADRSFDGNLSRTVRAMLWAACRAKPSANGIANPFYRVTHGRAHR